MKHSLRGIVRDDVVMIKGEEAVWPLISVLQEKILRAGALVDVLLVPRDNERGRTWSANVARFGTVSRLKALPEWQKLRYEHFTKYIEILGMASPELTTGVEGPVMHRILTLENELSKIRLRKPRVITMYPTPAFAKIEGLPFAQYRDIVVAASTQDPRKLGKMAERLAARLRKTRQIRIMTRHLRSGKACRLEVDIARRGIIKDTETLGNIPCGEVYTSPDARKVEGDIYLDMPVSAHGDVLRGIYLRFVSGRVVSFHAEKGHRRLAAILDTDAGAKRLGEIAFGINSGLIRPLAHPLFCEKLAGTMHIALGEAFPRAFVSDPTSRASRARMEAFVKDGIANNSAQHVDLVVSFRRGGAGEAVFLDERLLALRKGNWDPDHA
ncbi:MAG: hypothetical protein A2V88_02165 [Elusimicrobia bacterium RBG_16_66_12]|nr:MAG: hypothetical protein A2V88_02165 [Elusimicrobia bacterium RBG_16_66_12]